MAIDRDVVIVTGSSGLIGAATIRALAHKVVLVGFDREGDPHPPPLAECVCVDLTSDESVASGLDRVRYAYGNRIASVIHLAAYYDFSGEPSRLYEDITVRGTQRLLRGLAAFRVEQFVFSSTMLVHRPTTPGRPIDEDWPLEPKWDYPRSKVRTEELIRAQRGDIPVVLMRIAGVYDDVCHSIPIAHQIQRIYERTPTSTLFPGDISHGQAFVHLADVVECFRLAVERRRELTPTSLLLIGEPETPSYDEIQRVLAREIHGEEWETREIPKTIAKTGAWLQDRLPLADDAFIKPWMIDMADDHYELDIGRAQRLLRWEPKRRLRETLAKMVAALKADPVAWYREHDLAAPGWLGQPVCPSPAQETHGA